MSSPYLNSRWQEHTSYFCPGKCPQKFRFFSMPSCFWFRYQPGTERDTNRETNGSDPQCGLLGQMTHLTWCSVYHNSHLNATKLTSRTFCRVSGVIVNGTRFATAFSSASCSHSITLYQITY